MTHQIQPRPWWHRHRLRVSLRATMLFVLLMGIWFARYTISVRVQRDAVAAIKQAGGSVVYNWEWGTPYNPNIIDPNAKPRAPQWLVKLVGVDYFANVVGVNLMPRSTNEPNRADDETLAHVGRLSQVENLNLAGTAVTDAGLAHLEDLRNLRDLNLSNTQVSDAGLVHLRGLTNLWLLSLVGTNVSDDSVLELKHALHGGFKIIREEDLASPQQLFAKNRTLRFARSQPVRVAWSLLIHRARVMANARDDNELVATINAICDLEANDKDDLRKLARVRAECLDILEPDASPGLSDAERRALRQRCTDRWITALSLAIEKGFNNVPQLEDDSWDAGVLDTLREHPEFPKLVARMKAKHSSP